VVRRLLRAPRPDRRASEEGRERPGASTHDLSL
jgi:hypothetical protein